MELYCEENYDNLMLSCSKKYLPFLLGYRVECYALPHHSDCRSIWGLKGVKITLDGFNVIIKYDTLNWFWAGVVFSTIMENHIEEINLVILDDRVIKSLNFFDIKKSKSIKIRFVNLRDVYLCQSSIFYLVSPFRHDAYYINLGLYHHNRI